MTASTPRGNYHLRELPSRLFCESRRPAEFVEFATDAVLPRIEFNGYHRERKRETAIQIVHNLIETGLAGSCVSDTRSTSKPADRERIQVWDAIIRAGFARICKGSEEAARVTRYRATGDLLELRREWELRLLVDVHLRRLTDDSSGSHEYALIHVHSGKSDPATGEKLPKHLQKQPRPLRKIIETTAQPGPDGKPHPQAIANGIESFQEIEDQIELINRANLSHSWIAFSVDPESGREFAFQPNVCLRQIHSGELWRAVRLYSWSDLSGQQLSKESRRRMLIDGEPVAELDYSGFAIRKLYHHAKVDVRGDVYRPEKLMPEVYRRKAIREDIGDLVRDFIKRATNICLNVDNVRKANSSVGKALKEHAQSDALSRALYEIESITPKQLVARIIAAHPKISHHFFTGAGLRLMTSESNIMRRILWNLARRDVPALGIHDAVVCRSRDVKIVRREMVAAYYAHTMFNPTIKQAF